MEPANHEQKPVEGERSSLPGIFAELRAIADILPDSGDDIGWAAMPSVPPRDAGLAEVEDALAHLRLRAQSLALEAQSAVNERLALGSDAPQLESCEGEVFAPAPAPESAAQAAGRAVRKFVHDGVRATITCATQPTIDTSTAIGIACVSGVAIYSEINLIAAATFLGQAVLWGAAVFGLRHVLTRSGDPVSGGTFFKPNSVPSKQP